ncbi:PEP-CTERM/exosortase system-associated acyltransferase [Pseudorhodoferax sp.]|jgi:N-acyl amino acid synthase of PEP-CTERM/exosortase system|uniref:PEP-CTERM/exosortase system-associated acyltransferase n=1 Tax=Pseudorhodoferax sp. TaxID=1993553 RepID=UPI001B3CFC21|nr:PEP-CTERM/exosortase system-associated acyltransferase [Pseudorhodoferax sp.]MBP8144310.1 PEP-CTERM/exosortase system-associated acyltransferase [Inhella sp.]
MSSERNLGDSFQQYFEITPALSQDDREDVFRIRHEVYCRDLGWEPLRADGMETDAFDAQSVHCLLRHRGSGMLVGCTRLILADATQPQALLPFEESCAEVIDRRIADPAALPREQVAEVSRLAVMRDFRQRKGEQQSALAVGADDFEPRGPQSRFPFIPVSLYLCAAAIALRLGREYCFVLTEPRLAAHFSRIGFDIQTIGGVIEHRGERAPSLLRASKVVGEMRPLIRPFYEVVEASVNAAYARQAGGAS